jgi:hypothetical protein
MVSRTVWRRNQNRYARPNDDRGRLQDVPNFTEDEEETLAATWLLIYRRRHVAWDWSASAGRIKRTLGSL